MPRKPKEPTSLQRARKAHADRLREQGFKPKTFWLSPEALEALGRLREQLSATTGQPITESAAVCGAILASKAAAPARPPPPSEKAEGRRADPKPTKTPAKPPKASSEAVSQTAGRSDPLASVQIGPSPFTPRLKGLQKGKAK